LREYIQTFPVNSTTELVHSHNTSTMAKEIASFAIEIRLIATRFQRSAASTLHASSFANSDLKCLFTKVLLNTKTDESGSKHKY
jgi:hypothetical protein